MIIHAWKRRSSGFVTKVQDASSSGAYFIYTKEYSRVSSGFLWKYEEFDDSYQLAQQVFPATRVLPLQELNSVDGLAILSRRYGDNF